MVKAINDDEIKLRKRARRRLIGAIALVLLAILILPLVLDHEPASLAPDLAVITSNGKSDFTSRVVPVPPSVPPVETSENPAPMPAPPAEKPLVAGSSEGSRPGTAVSPIESESTEGRAVEKAESPAAAASKKEAETTKPKKAEKSAEVRKSATKAADDSKPRKTTAAAVEAKTQRSDTFAIQLESFANAANAKQLQEKLASNGVKSYTEVVETRQGKRTRVRVGPFATREAAEQALSNLKASGFSGIVSP